MIQTLHQVLDKTQEQSTLPLLLSLENVTICYEDIQKPIVQDINFSLYEGQSVLFLGPSGCGKSTLAMLCGGLIPETVEAQVSGHIWRQPNLTQPGRIGYVFQDPEAQFCMLTVGDEIAFGLENLSIPREQMQKRIFQGLQDANLQVQIQEAHQGFSGGMKQKLALACALSMEPAVLIFDEPTANLDPLSTSQVFQQIQSLRSRKKTMIVIEHKFEKLVTEMDQVVIFDRAGRIHRAGPAKEVVCEEWEWLIQEGIVDAWKRPPGQPDHAQTHFPISARENGSIQTKYQNNSLAGPPAFQCNHASLCLQQKQILHDIDLSIPQGAFVAVVGPNGAGKSSLLQMSAGLLRPSTGSIEWFGQPVRKAGRNLKQKVAFCFQNPEFQFIYERVGDELANQRINTAIPDTTKQLLQTFGLQGTEMQSPFSLSQGQKRRLSVATMIRDPHDIYFLDEPTFGQDARTKEVIMNHLKDLNDSGKTIVMTTHDMDLAVRYATDVAVVVNGQIRFWGSPSELLASKAVLQEAHLLDDLHMNDVQDTILVDDTVPTVFASSSNQPKKTPIRHLHPVWLLLGLMVVTGIVVQAETLAQSLAFFGYAFVLLLTIAWMSPWKIMKILSPLVVFYAIYIWSFAANAAIPPGTQATHFLWWTISLYGVKQGIILTFRMLATVLLGILYVWNTDMSDLMVGFSKDFRIPPKFAYGTLAGLRVIPLFHAEWTKLRQARQLRGKDARFVALRPVTYSLPLLSQGIRMSERVAIAMEARGMTGAPASHARCRTYYRKISVHWWDYVTQVALVVLAFVCLLLTSNPL